MTPRELDALVAERVMGVRWKEVRRILINGRECVAPDEGPPILWPDSYGDPLDPNPGANAGWSPMTYSTTGDGMLAVIERTRELGKPITIHAWTAEGSPRWRAFFLPPEAGPDLGANDDSLPRAVCLAALKAVGAIS